MNVPWCKPRTDLVGQNDFGSIRRQYKQQAGQENYNAFIDGVGNKGGGCR